MSSTAAKAIDRSISHEEIVTIPFDAKILAGLRGAAEGCTEANDRTELWGTKDGQEWRVHVLDSTDVG